MSRPAARPVLAYNLGRLGLFVGCAVLGYVAGLRSIALLVAALVVSGVLSYFLLARQRIAMAEVMTDVVTRGRARVAERAAEEDSYVDAMLADQHGAPPADPSRADRPAHSEVTRPDR